MNDSAVFDAIRFSAVGGNPKLMIREIMFELSDKKMRGGVDDRSHTADFFHCIQPNLHPFYKLAI